MPSRVHANPRRGRLDSNATARVLLTWVFSFVCGFVSMRVDDCTPRASVVGTASQELGLQRCRA